MEFNDKNVDFINDKLNDELTKRILPKIDIGFCISDDDKICCEIKSNNHFQTTPAIFKDNILDIRAYNQDGEEYGFIKGVKLLTLNISHKYSLFSGGTNGQTLFKIRFYYMDNRFYLDGIDIV